MAEKQGNCDTQSHSLVSCLKSFTPLSYLESLRAQVATFTANCDRLTTELAAAETARVEGEEREAGMLDEINELLVINNELNEDVKRAGGESRSLLATPARVAAAARAGRPPPPSSSLLPAGVAAKIEAALVDDLKEQLTAAQAETARLRQQLASGGSGAVAAAPAAPKANAAMDFFTQLRAGSGGPAASGEQSTANDDNGGNDGNGDGEVQGENLAAAAVPFGEVDTAL